MSLRTFLFRQVSVLAFVISQVALNGPCCRSNAQCQLW